MEEQDIRWEQRLRNYIRALSQLHKAVDLAKSRELSDLEEQGLIQSFEYTHELAWNVMKDFFEYQGNTEIKGSRDAIREAFSKGLIADGETWMKTINSRKLTVHTYNEEVAEEISNEIINTYFDLFIQFQTKMEEIRSGNQSKMFNEE